MKTRRISFAFAFVFLFLSITVVSCGNSEKQKEEQDIKEFEALTEIKPESPDVYLIVKSLNSNYWDTIRDCVVDEAKKQGCNLYYSGSQVETEAETQMTLLQKAVEAGADAIIIAPDDSLILSEPIANIYAQGIPVVLIDTTITTEDYDVCFMTDNLLAGQLAAEEMIRQLKLNGCKEDENVLIGIQVGSGSSQTINERLGGFTKYWSEHAPEKWTIIDDVMVNNGSIDVAIQDGNLFLEKYGDIKGMFGCNNGSTVGFATALMENNRTDIALVGFDYSDEIATLIADSDYCAATVLQRQDQMASQAVSAVMGLMNGEQSAVKFVDTGVIIVNKESIQTEELQEILHMLN